MDAVILPSQSATPRYAVFYFDFRDPFSYLVAGRVQKVCRDSGVSLTLEPVDSTALGDGRVDASAGSDFWDKVARAAAAEGLTLRAPARFPFDAALLLKTCLFVRDRSGQEAMSAVAERIWQAVWQQGADPADPETAISAGKGAAVPAAALRAGMTAPRADQMLARATQRAKERGVSQVPTLQVESDFFPGVEALPAAELRLRGEHAAHGASDERPGSPSALPDWFFGG